MTDELTPQNTNETSPETQGGSVVQSEDKSAETSQQAEVSSSTPDVQVVAPTTSYDYATNPLFVGSVLVDIDDKIYSLRKKDDGTFEGYHMTFRGDGSISEYHPITENDITFLRERGALISYESRQKNPHQTEEYKELVSSTKDLIIKLFQKGDTFDVHKRLSDEIHDHIKKILDKLEMITPNDQKELATYFFDFAIMKEFNTKNAYQVYVLTKGTVFADYFRQLEDLRLRGYGYGGFTL